MRFVPDDRSFPAELSLNAGVAIELQRYLIHGLFPLSSVPPISLPIRPAFRTNLWLTVSTGYFSLDLHHPSRLPLDLHLHHAAFFTRVPAHSSRYSFVPPAHSSK